MDEMEEHMINIPTPHPKKAIEQQKIHVITNQIAANRDGVKNNDFDRLNGGIHDQYSHTKSKQIHRTL